MSIEWLKHANFRMPAGAELRCPYRLGSTVNLRLRSAMEACDVLGDLRERAVAPFKYKGCELNMSVTLQTRERRTRNRLLLRAAELLRDSLRDAEDFKAARMKKPHDHVCWRSSSVVLCGRKRATFDAEKEEMVFEGGGGRRSSSRSRRRSWRGRSAERLDREDAGHFRFLGGRLWVPRQERSRSRRSSRGT